MNSRHAARTMLALLAPVLLSGAAAFIPAAHAGTNFKVLHCFTGGSDGAYPYAGLIEDSAGNLYGTTYEGGDTKCNPSRGCGTIFKLAPDGTETVLHAFTNGNGEGTFPEAGLIQDKMGNLYGTTALGGTHGYGTVFKLAPDGTEKVLHSFTGESGDGRAPAASLIQDRAGNLYGTTVLGGSTGCHGGEGCGTVFRLAPGGAETVLHAFTGGNDGAYPEDGLIRDKAGNLYGTTAEGGAYTFGTVFKLAPDGAETVLHTFTDQGGDGSGPLAGLIQDNAGNLYGTTEGGGTHENGTVFKLAPDGAETVLHSFNGRDGRYPYAGVIEDRRGNLYGTTLGGGGRGCAYSFGCGTIFKLAPDGTLTVLYAFSSHKHRGSLPYGAVIKGEHGRLYGTASEGGGGTGCPYGCGTVFRVKK